MARLMVRVISLVALAAGSTSGEAEMERALAEVGEFQRRLQPDAELVPAVGKKGSDD